MARSDPRAPMEAMLAAALPDGDGWQNEPKWDGFRCLAARDGGDVDLISKSGKPLGRYFPEIVTMLFGLQEKSFLLDGELILPVGDALSFEAPQMRLHPAESRIRRLSAETPAEYMLFDLLSLGGKSLAAQSLAERRLALERFLAAHSIPGLSLSPATASRAAAQAWLDHSGGALDGVIAKRADQPYRFSERAMVKVKQQRTADCVVGGFRYAEKKKEVVSLLLGLYDDAGLLHHVGFTSALKDEDRAVLTQRLEKLTKPPGFTGNPPAGRAVGPPRARPSGSRSRPSWWLRCATTRSPAAASATAPVSSAGAPTRRPRNAPSTRSPPSCAPRSWRNCSVDRQRIS
ncbi:MAG: ATP-dependent DNA ligase [Sphingomicrobium sp.]